MTTNLLKLAVLSVLVLSASATAKDVNDAVRRDTCVCKCQWAKDVGPMLPGTYTFAVQGQTCPAIIVGNDVPCRDDKGIVHVSGRHYDCEFVPAVLTSAL